MSSFAVTHTGQPGPLISLISGGRSCLRPDQFTLAANEELKALLYRRQYRERLRESQTMLFNQYDDMAEILKSIATELGSEISGSPLVERKLQKYLKSVEW
jgi:hypothetical protein